MKKKSKTNVFLFTIIMAIVFIFITEVIIFNHGSRLLYTAIKYYPKGDFVIQESILAVLVFIVMLIFKNSYVFTQEKQKFRVGLFYGLFYIISSIALILLFGVLFGAFKNGYAVLNLALACFLIGICEEFLCRGWLLNEFLERFGETKKGIWYSIIISGLIFGLMHIMNISAGQNAIGTITQVISAAATGIVFGLIYYKTKNIWSVVVLHGLWDFSLFTSELAPVYEKAETGFQLSSIAMVFTILMAVTELILIIPHVKDLNAKPKKGTIIGLSCMTFVLYFAFTMVNGSFAGSIGNVYKYDSINIEHYSLTRDNYVEYNINNNQVSLMLTLNENNNLSLINLNTNYKIEFDCNNLYDFIIFEEQNRYVLAYVDFVDTLNSYLKYVFIPKTSISNSNDFMNSLKNNVNQYLLPDAMELCIIKDNKNNKSYLTGYNVDYGYYLLTGDKQMSVLNRDN